MLPVSINYLHITDLHFGLSAQGWLWPRVKAEFFADLARLPPGGWDLVFFSGDLTQSGAEREFDALEAELLEFWGELERFGSRPKLCVVPGNHDLSRLQRNSAVALALSKLWQGDQDLRNAFWNDPTSEYRQAVANCFVNYENWRSKTSVPLLQGSKGLLPGDFAAVYKKGDISLGVVGLNSAALQLSGGNYFGKLALDARQISAACGEDPIKWRRGNIANVLVTHHPPSWLTPEGQRHFRAEINAPGDFQLHLCGHQHEPESVDVAEDGAATRRLRQAASLFGLENWDGDGGPEVRIHGYSATRLSISDTGVAEKTWPRRATRARSGALNCGQDPAYTLEADGAFNTALSAGLEGMQAQVGHSESVLLGLSLDGDATEAILARCPRLPTTFPGSHAAIRTEQRADLARKLEQRRRVWLAADWGLGAREFLVSSLGTNEQPRRSFILSCEEVAQVDGIEREVQRQFGVAIQTFCAAVEATGPSLLILENLHPELCSAEGLHRLLKIVDAILDYAPQLRAILTARLRPQGEDVPVVELAALELPDVRAYVANHADASPELLDADTIEKIYRRTDGLPFHIDGLLRGLRVSSLSSLLDVENDPDATVVEGSSTNPALVHAIASLMSDDRQAKRSVRLLKVLTVLPYGEAIETLKHYLQTEPFFYQHALTLLERSLLEIHIQHEAPEAYSRSGIAATAKILRVPRQVRDYVQSLLTEQERDELVQAGLDRFFGAGWREGKARWSATRMENRDLLGDGLGNEFALLSYLLTQGVRKGDAIGAERNARLAVQFARNLKSKARYRDLCVVTTAFLGLVSRDEFSAMWAELSALCGEGMRMMGRREEAISYLNDALGVGERTLSKDDKASIWIDLALSRASAGAREESVVAATEVQRLVPRLSSEWYQAQSIIVDATLKGRARAKRLVEMEREARNAGHKTVADNIALTLAMEAKDTKAKLRYHDRVLTSDVFSYNQVRAAVGKVQTLQGAGSVGNLQRSDLVLLAKAYSYLHAQRLNSLFEQCHEALWVEFEAKRETHQLLRLFRHTSFLWRIRGNEQREADYLRRLQVISVDPPQQQREGRLVSELQYFWARLRAVLRLAPP